MKKLIALALIANIGLAHANWDDPKKPFNASNIQDKTLTITWLPVDNVQKACEAENKKRGFKPYGFAVQACSFWEGKTCTIITSKNPNMHSLGHEMRHCYQGNWH